MSGPLDLVEIRELDLRDQDQPDLGFVKETWRQNLLASAGAGCMPYVVARVAYGDAIAVWLADPDTHVWVLESRQQPGLLLGFVVTYDREPQGRCLLYVFVKEKFRTNPDSELPAGQRGRFGFGSALLEAAGFRPGRPFVYCFKTREWSAVLRSSKRWVNGSYNPFPPRFSKPRARKDDQ